MKSPLEVRLGRLAIPPALRKKPAARKIREDQLDPPSAKPRHQGTGTPPAGDVA